MRYNFLHSALLAISLGLGGWVGHETSESGKRIAGLTTEVGGLREAVGKLERKMDDSMPRREFEARMALSEAKIREIEVEVSKRRGN